MNPLQTLRAMRPTLLLMSGRTVGLIATFAIPAVLARALDPADFGTYRLLFLVYATLLGVAQMGMAESLYYFVPQRPELAGRWVANAVVMLAGIGAVAAVLVAAAAPAAARWFSNPLLAGYLPKIGVFLGLMLASTSLEIVMVCRRKYRKAATVYGVSDVARAASLAVPALLAHSLDALLAGAIVFAAGRCLLAVAYLRRTFGPALAIDGTLWREQLAYALPFTAAVTVEIIQINFHQYAIALWFTPATFAIYSIGCLQIPIVDLLATSAANVMMVSMSDHVANGQSAIRLWHETVERLAFVFLPLVVVLLLTARHLIVLLFTEAYAASVPIFMVSALIIVLPAFPVDAVLRAYARTRTLLLLSLLRLAIIGSSIAWFVAALGLPGAVVVTLVAGVAAKVVGIVQVARLMGARLRQMLPWRSLAAIAAAATAAIAPAWLVETHLSAPPLVMLFAVGGVYGLSYLGMASGGAMLRAAMRPAIDATRAA